MRDHGERIGCGEEALPGQREGGAVEARGLSARGDGDEAAGSAALRRERARLKFEGTRGGVAEAGGGARASGRAARAGVEVLSRREAVEEGGVGRRRETVDARSGEAEFGGLTGGLRRSWFIARGLVGRHGGERRVVRRGVELGELGEIQRGKRRRRSRRLVPGAGGQIDLGLGDGAGSDRDVLWRARFGLDRIVARCEIEDRESAVTGGIHGLLPGVVLAAEVNPRRHRSDACRSEDASAKCAVERVLRKGSRGETEGERDRTERMHREARCRLARRCPE